LHRQVHRQEHRVIFQRNKLFISKKIYIIQRQAPSQRASNLLFRSGLPKLHFSNRNQKGKRKNMLSFFNFLRFRSTSILISSVKQMRLKLTLIRQFNLTTKLKCCEFADCEAMASLACLYLNLALASDDEGLFWCKILTRSFICFTNCCRCCWFLRKS